MSTAEQALDFIRVIKHACENAGDFSSVVVELYEVEKVGYKIEKTEVRDTLYTAEELYSIACYIEQNLTQKNEAKKDE